MIIQCDQCQTKFKLPDEKLKPTGVKVRCSHCKHIFKVMPPKPPEEKTPTPEPEEAPAPEPTPQPEPGTPEREPAAEEPSFENREQEPAPADEEEPAGADAGMSEFDFGDFGGTPEEDDFETPGEQDTEESSELDFSSAFDEDESDFSAERPEEEQDAAFGFDAGAAEEKEDREEQEEPGFGLDEETSGPSEFEFDEDEAAADFGFGEESAGDEFEFDDRGADDDFDFGDAGSEPDAFDFGDEDPFAEEEPAGSEPDEKEFRFTELSSDSGREPQQEESPPGSFAPAAMESEPPDAGGGDFEEEIPSAEEDDRLERPLPPPRKVEKKPKKKKSPLSRVLLLAFLLLVVLAGGVGYLYWQQGSVGLPAVDDLISRLVGERAAPVEGSIDIAGQSGRYVTNKQAGSLLVIEGRAVNRYPDSRANIRVQAVLYDAAERPIGKQNSYCGNVFTADQLRDLPFARIDESMNNAFGEALSNIDVPPGKSIPFMVVFKDLPENLDSFSVHALDSQPASAQ